MKTTLNILFLVVAMAGLINIVLGIFVLQHHYLIITGCLLVAIGAGWKYRNRKKDHPGNKDV